MAASGGRELAPGDAQRRAALRLFLAGERVEHVELVPGSREAALLELAGHRDQALGRGGGVLARGGAAPRVGAGAAVGEHAAGEDETVLALGPELGECLQLLVLEEMRRELELRLDVGLVPVRPDHPTPATRPAPAGAR